MNDRRLTIGLCLLLLVALLLRIYGLGDACFWLDEFDSMECSTGRGLANTALPQNLWIESPPVLTSMQGALPWTRIWTSLGRDNHPPLFFILLRGWRDLFGDDEAAVRSLSVVCSMIAVAAFAWTVRRQMPAEATLWAVAIMTVASSQVYFAQQARGYALWSALAMAGMLALQRLDRIAWAFILAITAIAMLLTHYFAFATLFSLLLIVCVARRRIGVAAIVAAAAIFAGVWGPIVWGQRGNVDVNNGWQRDPVDHHLVMTVQRFCLLPVRWLSEGAANRLHGPAAFAVAILVIALLAAIVATQRKSKAMIQWLLFLLPLPLLVAAVDILRHDRFLDVARYTFVAAPALAAMLGLFTIGPTRWIGRALCIGALALCITGLPGTYSDDQDWRLVATVLRNNIRPGDRIIYDSAGRENWQASALYLGVSYYAPDLPADVLLLTDDRAPALGSALSPGRTTWLLSARPNRMPTSLLPGAKIISQARVPDIGLVSQLSR